MPLSITMTTAQEDLNTDMSLDMSLKMDYWAEELSEAQIAHYSKSELEFQDIMSKVSEFISKEKGHILERGSDVLVLQGPAGTPHVSILNSLVTPVSQALSTNQKGCVISLQNQPQPQVPTLQGLTSQQLILQGGSVPPGSRVATTRGQTAGSFQSPQGTVQLVFDPTLSLWVGGLPNHQGSGNQALQSTPAPPSPTQATPRSWTRAPSGPVVTKPTAAKSIACKPTILKPIASKPTASKPTASKPTAAKPTAAKAPSTPAPSIQAPSIQAPSIQAPSIQAPSTQAPSTQAPSTQAPSTQAVVVSMPPAAVPAAAASITTASSVAPSQKAPKQKTVTSTAQALPTHCIIPVSICRPSENTSLGGLSAGNNKKGTPDDGKSNASGPDSTEVTFNKLSGKTFPSLVVLARPHLKVREMSGAKINNERSFLDTKVKCVLMYSAAAFSEWLLQQGLVRSEQICSVHSAPDKPVHMKLGLYSDVSKFPFSGGYVWSSDCCPKRFVSLFSGSIFEGSPHPPSVLLKLMYHWCCQTNVQNVVQWVKVDNFYVKNFFTYMRSVCVAAVHENYEKLGGPQKKVEVGVISLGTTSQDGNMRQVKVEVLGIMDPESKLVRLRAVEPLQEGERNYKRRFVKILEPLAQWVHHESVILTDFTVDKNTLISMGFTQVHQSTIPDPPSIGGKLSNQNIMEYLRRIVPRMFQNTLSLLSRQIIQQFLDELVWRERWGAIPSQAFNSLVSHIAAQSKIDAGENLVIKLGKIAINPFRCWEYKHWSRNGLDFAAVPIENFIASTSSFLATSSSHKVYGRSKAEVAPINLRAEDEFYPPRIARTTPYVFTVNAEIESNIRAALKKGDKLSSLKEAVETYKLPRSIVLARAQDFLKSKQPGGQTVFTEFEELDMVDHIMTLHEWGYSFGRWDIRMLVKQYLDVCGRIENRFKDNFPGDPWIEKFLARHRIVKDYLCRNIPSRGAFVDSEAVKRYILNLSSSIPNLPAQNILNFMEIGLTGDPLKSMTLELRELRYPVGKRKVKSSAAVMLACTGLGKVLPAFVIFEGKSPNGAYYCSKSGWFDETAFEQWIETVLLPWADGLQGPKVLIGDSLAQLFNLKTMALCLDKDISFACMPCSVSGILSPLDVVLCDKLRIQWRNQTRSWASCHSDKYITIEEFPDHILELLTSTITSDLSEHLRKAFKVIGLYPFCSKNTMQALENGGVHLNEPEKTQSQEDLKRRKRIFIGTDVELKKKSPAVVSFAEEVVLDYGGADADEDFVELEPHYYGSVLPNAELIASEVKADNLNSKCPLCQSHVSDNLTLMKHLLGHSEKQPNVEEISSINICIYCTQKFSTPEEKETHIQNAHKGLSSQDNACLICSKRMMSRGALLRHMKLTHTKLELPYLCTICFFRSSEQYKVIDHFYEVHGGGEKVQCPYCLKCLAINNMGKKLPANTFFFMHHVKKHQSNTSRKCSKCNLWFVHRGLLKDHQTKDHRSCEDVPNVVPYCNKSLDGIKISLSRKYAVEDSEPEGEVPGLSKKQLTIRGLMTSQYCLECKSNLAGGSHFVHHMSCTQCSFSTYCNVAMNKHKQVFPCKGRQQCTAGKSAIALPAEMYCVCGFQSSDGNILATHLVSCKQSTAYPSAVCANDVLAVDQQLTSFPSISRSGPSSTLKHLGLVPNPMENISDSVASPLQTEDECSKNRPGSQASTSSNSSYSKKRKAQEAGLDSTTGNNEVKDKRYNPETHSRVNTDCIVKTDNNCDSSETMKNL